MGTRLFVGNLSFGVTEDQLRTLFEEGGRQVTSVTIVVDRDTGRPRGFGFVDMGSDSDAEAAIRALNGRDLGGRALTVNEARERPPRTGGFGGGGDRGRRGGGGGGRRGY
ncbi:MAG TPA: RNA-binding protein [Candidatus Sulfotelmatobacter sp.]|jgi:RNA recognition motif-containing protein|nr:RNA-binding protein [Candidatus Sulfotelmatobacter sp.]